MVPKGTPIEQMPPPLEQPADNLKKVLQSIELKWYELHQVHQELLSRTGFLAAQLTSLRRALGYSRQRLVKDAKISFDALASAENGWLKSEHVGEVVKLVEFYRLLLQPH